MVSTAHAAELPAPVPARSGAVATPLPPLPSGPLEAELKKVRKQIYNPVLVGDT